MLPQRVVVCVAVNGERLYWQRVIIRMVIRYIKLIDMLMVTMYEWGIIIFDHYTYGGGYNDGSLTLFPLFLFDPVYY